MAKGLTRLVEAEIEKIQALGVQKPMPADSQGCRKKEVGQAPESTTERGKANSRPKRFS
jgi:hypothetical protein